MGIGPMLPVTLQFLIATIAYALNQRMARRVDYLQEEVRVLKEGLAAATGKTRIKLSAEQRRRLALTGKELTAEERRACCQIVRPETTMSRRNRQGDRVYFFQRPAKAPGPRRDSVAPERPAEAGVSWWSGRGA
jgi:hypothetical protein